MGITDTGHRLIAEIDESVSFKRKYNRGRIQNNQWFIGGIERGARNCFIVSVENRNAVTVSRILTRFIRPGLMVVTDCWRAYSRAISDTDSHIIHRTVNHSLNFVDPEDSNIHTPNIEGLRSRSKYFMRKKAGCSVDQISSYLIQFLWMYKIERHKRFNEILILLNYRNFQWG